MKSPAAIAATMRVQAAAAGVDTATIINRQRAATATAASAATGTAGRSTQTEGVGTMLDIETAAWVALGIIISKYIRKMAKPEV